MLSATLTNMPFAVDYGRHREEILNLRSMSWQALNDLPNEGLSLEDWEDPWDAVGLHFVVKEEGQLIAASRLSIHTESREVPGYPMLAHYFLDQPPSFPIAVFKHLVVHPEYLRRKLANTMDEARTSAAREKGCAMILADAHGFRVRSLQKRGFKILGPLIPVEGLSWMETEIMSSIDHFALYKRLF